MHTRCARANAGIILAGAVLVAGAEPPASTVPATQPSPVTSSQPATGPVLSAGAEVDAILLRLEARRVTDLRARVSWRLHYVLDAEDEALTKLGDLWFQDTKPVARFLIHFRERRAPDGRSDPLDERHLFDGEWYTEVQSQARSVTRRQVRSATDPGNPYRVGEGTFPLPFGQKKDDILREFEVFLLDRADNDPPDTDRLRLKPRPHTRAATEYGELHFWIVRDGLLAGLPIRVQVAKLDGTGKLNSTITIQFRNVELNTGLDDRLFRIEVPAGYTETVEPL